MVKIVKPRLDNVNIEFAERLEEFIVNDEWMRALSNLIGYDYANEQFLLIGVDENGNLKIDLSSNPTDTLTPSNASVSTTAKVIANSNADRSKITIYNNDSKTVYISDDNGVTVSTGFPLPGYSSKEFNNFTGAIYGIVITGTADVSVLEESN